MLIISVNISEVINSVNFYNSDTLKSIKIDSGLELTDMKN